MDTLLATQNEKFIMMSISATRLRAHRTHTSRCRVVKDIHDEMTSTMHEANALVDASHVLAAAITAADDILIAECAAAPESAAVSLEVMFASYPNHTHRAAHFAHAAVLAQYIAPVDATQNMQ